jgi:hypothetical protein
MLALGFRTTYRIISIVISAAIVYLIVSGIQVEIASRHTRATPSLQRASAIVVTGTPSVRNLSSDFRDKLRLAVSLYRKGRAPLLVVGLPSGVSRSGRISPQWSKELSPVAKVSEITGVAASNVGTELSKVEKRVGHGRRIIVVTDAINTLYMEGIASNHSFKPAVVAPRASHKNLFAQISPLFREASGVAVARALGYSVANWASQ